MRIIKVCALCLIMVISACNRQTTEKENYDNGKLKSEKIYEEVDGEKVLLKEVHYHPNGQKYMEGSYKDNKREGKWYSWYDNGQLWSEGDFINGQSEGKWTVFHPNGKLYYEGSFKNGERVGTWRYFDDGGNLTKEVNYSEK